MKLMFMVLFIVGMIAATKYIITPLSEHYSENKIVQKEKV